MKLNIILFSLFFTIVLVAFSFPPDNPLERIGNTQLNGDGCVCHAFVPDPQVMVWVEGPDSLAPGQTALYRMLMAGGPAEAGGYNVASRFGTLTATDTLSFWDPRDPNELTQAFPLIFPTPQDTIFWEFAYNAPDTLLIDTIYSVGLSCVFDGVPDSLDIWDFGPKFSVTITDQIVPVELASFRAYVSGSNVNLEWQTTSELNNRGFSIERKSRNDESWRDLGFVQGAGTTTELKSYSFTDQNPLNDVLHYRLKQIDFDGTFKYYSAADVNGSEISFGYSLDQNYPNPFNPSTVIQFQIKQRQFVSLKVYDIKGALVLTLVNEYKDEGTHKVEFSNRDVKNSLPSGVYLYRLESGEFSSTRKMLLIK